MNWNDLFSHKNEHEQVAIFNQTLTNVFSNYVPKKFIAIDDKDLPWMNEYIKRKIMDKKVACKSFNTNNKTYDSYVNLQTVSTKLSEMILKRKDDYHSQLSNKLNDPKTSAKAYWSVLKTLYNGKKFPLILPLFQSLTSLYQILRRKQTILMLSLHLNILQSLMIVLHPVQPILFLMLVYHPFNSKTKIVLRLHLPLTIIKTMVMMIYL